LNHWLQEHYIVVWYCVVSGNAVDIAASLEKENATRDIGIQWEDRSQHDHNYSAPHRRHHSDSSVASQTPVIETESKGVGCEFDSGAATVANLLSTDTDALLYTGITLTAFHTLVTVMTAHADVPYRLPVGDQILLTLMKLRLNLIFADLARRFRISESLASRIFSSWLDILAAKLKDLIVWLPRETIRACMPTAFKEHYPKTTCIIDCAESFIQKPTNLTSRNETYSHYKSHNTAKYMVAISPHGQIMFVTKAYGGRASDKFIVQDSGFLDKLVPGDEVMADRGFTIDDLLYPLRVKLNIPAFTKGKPQLSDQEVTITRRIATVRIHVERAIRRLKVFKILSQTAPIASLDKTDKILCVCSALVNLRPNLVRDVENVND
jgi:hypothetical protein